MSLLTLHRIAPGNLGLNLQRANEQLSVSWCIQASNAIIDITGRLQCRQGTKRTTSSALGGTVKQIFQYKDKSGNIIEIAAANNKIFKINSNGTSTDITGTITTPTDDNWKFQNFNGKCVGIQAGHAPIVLATTSGSFADISLSGTQQPTTAAVDWVSAYGYLFCLDGTNIKYSDLLDETAWNGVYDLTTVWTQGIDSAISVTVFNGLLIIFSDNSSIVYANANTPSSLILSDVLDVGCTARDSVVSTGRDLLFLSRDGVHSLGRLLVQKSSPLSLISGNVTDNLIQNASSATLTKCRGCYDPYNGFYLLSFPDQVITYVFFTREPPTDQLGSLKATTWDSPVIYAMHSSFDQSLHFGDSNGYVLNYTGYQDDVTYAGTGGNSYFWQVTLGNSDFSEEVDPQIATRLKVLKDYSALVQSVAAGQVTLSWAYDYVRIYGSEAVTAPSVTLAEYGIGEYGIAEWSSSVYPNSLLSAPQDEGQVVSFGLSATVNGNVISLQAITSRFKLGRLGI